MTTKLNSVSPAPASEDRGQPDQGYESNTFSFNSKSFVTLPGPSSTPTATAESTSCSQLLFSSSTSATKTKQHRQLHHYGPPRGSLLKSPVTARSHLRLPVNSPGNCSCDPLTLTGADQHEGEASLNPKSVEVLLPSCTLSAEHLVVPHYSCTTGGHKNFGYEVDKQVLGERRAATYGYNSHGVLGDSVPMLSCSRPASRSAREQLIGVLKGASSRPSPRSPAVDAPVGAVGGGSRHEDKLHSGTSCCEESSCCDLVAGGCAKKNADQNVDGGACHNQGKNSSSRRQNIGEERGSTRNEREQQASTKRATKDHVRIGAMTGKSVPSGVFSSRRRNVKIAPGATSTSDTSNGAAGPLLMSGSQQSQSVEGILEKGPTRQSQKKDSGRDLITMLGRKSKSSRDAAGQGEGSGRYDTSSRDHGILAQGSCQKKASSKSGIESDLTKSAQRSQCRTDVADLALALKRLQRHEVRKNEERQKRMHDAEDCTTPGADPVNFTTMTGSMNGCRETRDGTDRTSLEATHVSQSHTSGVQVQVHRSTGPAQYRSLRVRRERSHRQDMSVSGARALDTENKFSVGGGFNLSELARKLATLEMSVARTSSPTSKILGPEDHVKARGPQDKRGHDHENVGDQEGDRGVVGKDARESNDETATGRSSSASPTREEDYTPRKMLIVGACSGAREGEAEKLQRAGSAASTTAGLSTTSHGRGEVSTTAGLTDRNPPVSAASDSSCSSGASHKTAEFAGGHPLSAVRATAPEVGRLHEEDGAAPDEKDQRHGMMPTETLGPLHLKNRELMPPRRRLFTAAPTSNGLQFLDSTSRQNLPLDSIQEDPLATGMQPPTGVVDTNDQGTTCSSCTAPEGRLALSLTQTRDDPSLQIDLPRRNAVIVPDSLLREPTDRVEFSFDSRSQSLLQFDGSGIRGPLRNSPLMPEDNLQEVSVNRGTMGHNDSADLSRQLSQHLYGAMSDLSLTLTTATAGGSRSGRGGAGGRERQNIEESSTMVGSGTCASRVVTERPLATSTSAKSEGSPSGVADAWAAINTESGALVRREGPRGAELNKEASAPSAPPVKMMCLSASHERASASAEVPQAASREAVGRRAAPEAGA